jgi:hypothetical protein
MNKRIYNKLYVNKNREEGSEKILLGYQHNIKEIRLKKNEETYFHIPYYTNPISIHSTSLIVDGATGGPFPAASDRIFKSQKNYGNVTHHGTPSSHVADGLWYCSWLYRDEQDNLIWLDRFYNPGNFVFSGARRALLTSGPIYKDNNPVFKDVPSTLMLDPGILYRYFHVGELTAQDLVKTFSGEAEDRLILNFENWGEDNVNTVNDLINPTIATKESKNSLYSQFSFPERTDKKTINFDSKHSVDVSFNYDDSYNPTNEFTATCWVQSPDWNEMPTTQLFGNFSSRGGYGVFVQNLSSYPFFVIPETHYGHVLFVNEKINGYADKSVQITPIVNVNPSFACIDFDQNVVVCNENDRTGTIYKLDNAGTLIASTKNPDAPFSYIYSSEYPIQMLIGKDNEVVVRTQKAIYTFDYNLKIIDRALYNSTENDVAAYRYDTENDTYELEITENVLDSKFVENTHWYITSGGDLYRQFQFDSPELFYAFADKAQTFTIDPENNIWVLHGNNRLSVFDSRLPAFSKPIVSVDVGLNVFHDKKNISFICAYDKEKNTREWKAIVYYSNERYIYILDSEGVLTNALDSASLFDQTLIKTLDHKSENFKFFGKGDFTGYEHKRVFKNLSPYKNQNQLVIKASLKDTLNRTLKFDQFVNRAPLVGWTEGSWQHIALVLKNKTFITYANAQQMNKLSFTGRHALSYDLQPSYFIGTSAGSQVGFNIETRCVSQIHNGLIGDFKIYNYALDQSNLNIFLHSFSLSNDIYWNMPVPLVQYVEKIERLFKNKVPGSKAAVYRVKIRGTQIQDVNARNIITEQLRSNLEQAHPGYTDLLEIQWID